jgi:quinol monooxygenase YgiN
MIRVIATIHLQPETRDAFLKEFRELVPKVLDEDGCISYGPNVDVESGLDAQLPVRPNTVTILEQWQDLHALRRHLKMPHMAEYRENVADYVESVELQVLEPA